MKKKEIYIATVLKESKDKFAFVRLQNYDWQMVAIEK